MKKYIMMLFVIVLFTGCTVNYNMTFKKNHEFDEQVTVKEKIKNIDTSEYTLEEILNSKIDSYSSKIKEGLFSKKKINNGTYIGVKLKSKNKDIIKLKRNSYFQQIFNDVEIKETKEYYSFKTNAYYGHRVLFDDYTHSDSEKVLDKVNINITFEDEVIECNADKVNKDTNTYTWVLDKSVTDKSIEFKLKNTNFKKKKSNTKKLLIDIFKIVFIIIGIGLLGCMFYGFKIMHDNNRI